jgi:hypothetical protein
MADKRPKKALVNKQIPNKIRYICKSNNMKSKLITGGGNPLF